MKNITITRSINSPVITLLPEEGIIAIKGRSNSIYSQGVYEPILERISAQFKGLSSIRLDLSLMHFNTSSRKWLCEIFEVLKGFESEGTQVTVNWYYETDDIDMLEDGEDFEMITELPFTFHAVSECEFYEMMIAV